MSFVVAAVPAVGQLQPSEVLVIYDSRIQVGGVAVSRDVAEYYAGSAAVPGGVGNLPAKRPGVLAVDLASIAPVPPLPTAPPNISYPDFIARIRDPLRNYLQTSGLTRRIRCFVLTKGLPHRILDINNNFIADFPNEIYIDAMQSRNVTAASVDSELSLLFQNLSSGETNGNADSKADGCVLNPYWKSNAFISGFSTVNIESAKSFLASGTAGPVWNITGSGATRLTAGDMYLVTRLDGNTVQDVRGAIDRAQNPYVNTATATLIFDESDSNGIADASTNAELDNATGFLSLLRASDDYETARNLLFTDRRFGTAAAPGNIRYDEFRGTANFFVGPLRAFAPGQGIILPADRPVLLLATYGGNHAPEFVGVPVYATGQSAYDSYASSHVLAPGAIFNTIESFNGRALGGLGGQPFAPQEQVANWIAYGGTFAIGMCWEPLADSVADNVYLVQNFILGNMTWAEAAWTSIPAVSWMHIVIGDPLAKLTRSTEDINGDQRLSIEDVYAWDQSPTDVNRDGAINQADKTLLVRTLRAPERNDAASLRR